MPAQPQTPQEQLLLTRKASLAAMSLGTGLTHVRRYNYAHTGYFFSGMYSYCVGLERVLKIVAVYDHRLSNANRFPTNSVLKDFSHSLASLLAHAEAIVSARSLSVDLSHTADSLHPKIVGWLTDFAQTTRYYNLDMLTGRAHAEDEPLVRWEKEVCTEIVARHYRPSAARLEELAVVKRMLGSFAHVQHTSGAGRRLNDAASAVDESAVASVKQKYSAYYIYRLLCFACQVLRDLEYAGNFYPNLSEFFPLFTSTDPHGYWRAKHGIRTNASRLLNIY